MVLAAVTMIVIILIVLILCSQTPLFRILRIFILAGS
jgi:hypothetical protein